jgi:hypothetical protein
LRSNSNCLLIFDFVEPLQLIIGGVNDTLRVKGSCAIAFRTPPQNSQLPFILNVICDFFKRFYRQKPSHFQLEF